MILLWTPWPRRTGNGHHWGSAQSPQRISASVTPTTQATSLRKSRVEFPNHMICDGRDKVVISPKHVSLDSAQRSTDQNDQPDLHLLGKLLLLPWWGSRGQELSSCQTQGKAGIEVTSCPECIFLCKHSKAFRSLCCDISSPFRAIVIIIICLGLINFFPNYERNSCSLQKMSSLFMMILLISPIALKLSDAMRKVQVLNLDRSEFEHQFYTIQQVCGLRQRKE